MYMHRILIVEDDLSLLEVFRVTLRRDYEVVLAEDGMTGYRHSQVAEPDLIIMDLGMPGMNGIELTHTIKANPQMSQVPIIVITGDTSNKTRDEVLKMGVDLMVYKPFEMDTMLNHIQTFLKLVPKSDKKMTLYDIQGYE